jgi:hypothetical protein
MHRTGTRSLAKYCETLGMKSIHWPWWCEREISRHLDLQERIVDVLEPLIFSHDVFTDVPFPGLYRILDERFPKSRFILVTRDPRDWWRSLCRHWELEKGPHRLTPLEEVVYRQYEPSNRPWITLEDADLIMAKFQTHTNEVQAFFANRRGKLLSVDLADEHIDTRISDFLGMERMPYPRERSEEWP